MPLTWLFSVSLSEARGLSIDEDAETSFRNFVAEYDRSYSEGSPEYYERFALYRRRLAEVEQQNAQVDRLWTAAINTFADRTEEERAVLRGWRRSGDDVDQKGAAETDRASGTELGSGESLLEHVDWRNLTIALQVPDQGACGSCWAVTTTSVLDAHHEIYNKKNRHFSPQELVSCVQNPGHCGGKGGCDGATVELGMQYALKSGLSTLTETPYQGRDVPCKSAKAPILAESGGAEDEGGNGNGGHAFGLIGWNMLPRNKEAPLARAVVEKGPVGVSVAAAHWFSYSTGIFNHCKKDCIVDHAVTLYGFSKLGSQKYWLIRNSWGKKWGEKGFIRMARTDNEEQHCGTDADNQKGTGCDKDPKKVPVCGMCGILYDSVVPSFKVKPTNLVAGPSAASGGDAGAEESATPQQPVLVQAEVQQHVVAADGAVAAMVEEAPLPSAAVDSFSRLVRREA